jgi:hypothetical protein
MVKQTLFFLFVILVFGLYTYRIGTNPPGFYVDESALSYNAYLVSQTGAGEFGSPGTFYFQIYTGGWTQYANPTQIYVLALVFFFLGPSILVAKMTAAVCVFIACILLGWLAYRLSKDNAAVGVAVGLIAVVTPWLFEISRLVLETFFYPLAVTLLIWAVFKASQKERWSWLDIASITGALALVTYSYTIGRLLGVLLAFSLICFAESRSKLFDVFKTWTAYGITLIPLLIYNIRNPELRTRFYLISYIKPDTPISEIIWKFVSRYIEDLNPVTMMIYGDSNARHHIQTALGSIFIAAFILFIIGLVVIIVRHRKSAWWRFILMGLLVSAVPGAMTLDKFHTLRMIAFPVFFIVLLIPAIEWLFDRKEISANSSKLRLALTVLIGVLMLAETTYFYKQYHLTGENRGTSFDSGYKVLYDKAVSFPQRPIYLEDGYWGPMYINAFWYATIEGRDTSEFVHLPHGGQAPANSIVISSEKTCFECDIIDRSGIFLLYRRRSVQISEPVKTPTVPPQTNR